MRSPSLSSATTDFEDLGETLPAPDVAVVPLQVDELSIHQSTAEKSIAPKSMSPQQSQVSQDPNITYREHDTYYRMQRVVVQGTLFQIPVYVWDKLMSQSHAWTVEARFFDMLDVAEFECLAEYMYHCDNALYILTFDMCRKLLKTSKTLGLTNIRDRAIAAIEKLDVNPVDKLLVATEFAIDAWLAPCYEALSTRLEGLDDAEYMRLGAEKSILILRSREAVLQALISFMKTRSSTVGQCSARQSLFPGIVTGIVQKIVWPEREKEKLAVAAKAAEEAAKILKAKAHAQEAENLSIRLKKRLEAASSAQAFFLATAAKLEEARVLHTKATQSVEETVAETRRHNAPDLNSEKNGIDSSQHGPVGQPFFDMNKELDFPSHQEQAEIDYVSEGFVEDDDEAATYKKKKKKCRK